MLSYQVVGKCDQAVKVLASYPCTMKVIAVNAKETGVRMDTGRMQAFGKRGIAIFATLCLALMTASVAAFATIDGKTYRVEVDATSADASNTETSGQAINTDGNGLGVYAANGHTGTATVGNVNCVGTTDAPVENGIYANASGGNAAVNAGAITGSYRSNAVQLKGSSSSDNITGNITVDSVNVSLVSNGYGPNYGINSEAGERAKLNATVNGSVTIPTGVSGYTTAVRSKTTAATAESAVTVGDVDVAGVDRALYVEANGGTARLTAGEVTATDVGSGSYTKSAVYANANAGATNLTMGNLNGLGGTYVGMKVYASNAGTLTVNAGDISTVAESSTSGSYGLDGSTSDAESVATVKVGNVSAKSYGINLAANNNSTLNLETGNISGAQWNSLEASGGYIMATLGNIESSAHTGLDVHGKNDAGSKFEVTTGSITSPEKALSFYTYAPSNAPDKITVNGNLTSTGTTHEGGGIYASSSQGYVDLTVNGNVTSNYYTISGNLGGTAIITGDVISTYDGNNIPAISGVAYSAPLDMLVKGTISSNGPALNNNATGYGKLTLTAWKVTSATGTHFQGDDAAGTFAKSVKYIARVDQPTAGGTLSATKADGTALDTSHELGVAKEGDRVLLKADLQEGYRIVKAYNGTGDDKVELSKDANGNYYYDVPRGGGIELSAEVSNEYTVKFVDDDDTVILSTSYTYGTAADDVVRPRTPQKPSTAQYTYTFTGWTPEIAAVTADAIYKATYSAAVNNYTIKFVDDDGTEFSSTSYPYGTPAASIVKPPDPSKSATAQYTYTFAGWNPAVANVTGNATYTASYNATVNKYTVSFDSDGGDAVPAQSVEYGSTASQPTIPVKSGYVFQEWQLNGEKYDFATPVTGDVNLKAVYLKYEEAARVMYRLYNPNSGEHFYTAEEAERDAVAAAGWNYEGEGWTAPVPVVSNTPVYRLYSGTDHHYTTNLEEKDWLVEMGWSYEGIGWYSDDGQRVPLYRQFNPNVDPTASFNNSGSHNYTTSKDENDALVAQGWIAEGFAWYGLRYI